MKRFLLFTTMLFMALGVFAQRAAVMEFKAGVGISQADVDGISAIFITYFRPAGYTMVERTQIDRVIDEQGFQRSRLTERQMVRIGKILNVSKIVIGDVNVVMGQYNVDVRVINVESGSIAATEGATFSGTSYRTSMQSVAQKLASKIAVSTESFGLSSTTSSAATTANKRATVETVYGYLHVFPNELGVFQSEPTNVIANINAQKLYGYNDWRLPTNEELSLLHANGYLSSGFYMTQKSRSGIVLLVTTSKSVEELLSQGELVDLGLPSGTLWYAKNEGGEDNRYNHTEAILRFGDKLPTKEQLAELRNYCTWNPTTGGYKVIGPNGNSINLPYKGYHNSFLGYVRQVGLEGYYWSSTPDNDKAFYLYFSSNGMRKISSITRDFSLSVRLVID